MSEEVSAMPTIKTMLSTMAAFWLFPSVPVIAWLVAHTEGISAVLFFALLLYLMSGFVIGVPLLIVGLFTRRR